jgi:single-strand DNA-binding protein
MSINKVILLGNLGHDVSYREFENGQVAQFSVATTEKGYKTKDGKDIPDKTEWHNVVLIGGLAKVAKDYLKKGDKVYIEGKIRTRKYTNQSGEEKQIVEIIGTSMELLTPKPKTAPISENDFDDLPEAF